MAATLPDISVGQDWVDINTTSGIAVGTAITILNKGGGEVLISESDTEPTDNNSSLVLTTTNHPYAMGSADAGSIRVWCKARGVLNSIINIQEI